PAQTALKEIPSVPIYALQESGRRGWKRPQGGGGRHRLPSPAAEKTQYAAASRPRYGRPERQAAQAACKQGGTVGLMTSSPLSDSGVGFFVGEMPAHRGLHHPSCLPFEGRWQRRQALTERSCQVSCPPPWAWETARRARRLG